MRDEAYFVLPESGSPGPGVLLLCSQWGLTPALRQRADRLSEAGLTVLAPDLTFGARPYTVEDVEEMLADLDVDRLASLVLGSAGLLAEKSSGDGIGVVGLGMGGSMGLWLSVRNAPLVDAVVSFYGSQQIDFAGADARYSLHLAETDRWVSEDDIAFMEATMGLEGLEVSSTVHQGTSHGFAEPEDPNFDVVTAEKAWAATTDFLVETLK
ncbi:MAG: hypothetical protein GEU79_11370 [Acidimicrobiia bacterium]|nr:hypothetical protein [Acidimicrobiia bacterium]